MLGATAQVAMVQGWASLELPARVSSGNSSDAGGGGGETDQVHSSSGGDHHRAHARTRARACACVRWPCVRRPCAQCLCPCQCMHACRIYNEPDESESADTRIHRHVYRPGIRVGFIAIYPSDQVSQHSLEAVLKMVLRISLVGGKVDAVISHSTIDR